MKKKLPILCVLLMALSILVQGTGLAAFAAPGDKLIATGNVNFRSGPSSSYSKIDYILKGQEVEHVSQYNSSWDKIIFNGKTGYAAAKYFKSASLESTSKQPYVTTVNVNFRTGPSTTYASRGIVSKGATVEFLSTSNNWAQVIYNGVTGYMYASYLSPITNTAPGNPPQTSSAYITIADINFRSGPSTSYASQGIVSKGTTVEFLSASNNWAKVTHNGVTGYMYASYLSPVTNTSPSNPPQTSSAYITTADINFRSGPSTSYASQGIVSKGTTVEFLSASNNWAKVIYDGVTGYMYASYLSPVTNTTSPSPAIPNTSVYRTTANVNFRTGPSTSYASNGIIRKGTTLDYISQSGLWAKVIVNGVIGYMHASYITPSTSSPNSTPDPIPDPTPNKPIKVGIPWTGNRSNSLVTKTVSSIKLAGGEVVHLAKVTNAKEAAAQLARVDAVVPTGGSDIGAKYYGQSTSKYMEYVNQARDLSDYHIIRLADNLDMPMLGLCRGAQFMNVVRGGLLYQDIDNQRSRRSTYIKHRAANSAWTNHNIRVYDNSKLGSAMGQGTHYVNSWHHQGIRTLGNNIKVTAVSADSLIEGFEATNRKFFVGVQFHPEYLTTGKNASANLGIFKALIEAAE